MKNVKPNKLIASRTKNNRNSTDNWGGMRAALKAYLSFVIFTCDDHIIAKPFTHKKAAVVLYLTSYLNLKWNKLSILRVAFESRFDFKCDWLSYSFQLIFDLMDMPIQILYCSILLDIDCLFLCKRVGCVQTRHWIALMANFWQILAIAFENTLTLQYRPLIGLTLGMWIFFENGRPKRLDQSRPTLYPLWFSR